MKIEGDTHMQEVLQRDGAESPTLVHRLQEELAVLREQLADLGRACGKGLPMEAAASLCAAPGKGLRPLLVLTTAHLHSPAPKERAALALSTELLHMGSLIHDDILDEATMRRKLPTAHALWGARLAHLSGDWFLTRAWSMLCEELPRSLAAFDIFADLARTGDRLFQGQVLEWKMQGDLEARGKSKAPRDEEITRWEKLARNKTGSLLAFSARSGARLCQASPVEIEALGSYGEALGLAFQLSDDLEDWQEEVGEASLRPHFPDLDPEEGRSRACARAHAYCRLASASLAPLPEGEVRAVLEEIAIYASDRRKRPAVFERLSSPPSA